MISKLEKEKILKNYTKKEDRILASKVIDDVNKFEMKNVTIHTDFLSIYEKEIVINVLNALSVNYIVFCELEYIERFVIFLVPDYIEENSIFDEYIACIKIKPVSSQIVLEHKNYMGAIYSTRNR